MTRRRRRRAGLLGAAALLHAALGGCGDRDAAGPAQAPSAAPTAATPEEAERALATARAAEERGDEPALARALEAAERADGEAGCIATTWQLTRALQVDDPEGAVARLLRIVARHDGTGIDAQGRRLPAGTLAAAIVDVAATAARAAVEGPRPDPALATRRLEAGERAIAAVAETAEDGGEMAGALASARRYVELDRPPSTLATRLPSLPHRGGARVLVLADHFALGEPILPSVLARWSRRLPVGVLGVSVGAIRRGIRRQAVGPEEERRTLSARVAELGLLDEGVVEAEAARTALGLPERFGAVVFVIGADDRIEARASGPSVDPRALDPVIDRVAGPAPGSAPR